MSAANRFLASALAGAATGARSFTSLGVLAVTAKPTAHGQPDRFLSKPAAKGLIALAAVQELVMDKLPMTPSRVEVPGLVSRGVGAAGSAVIIARREPQRTDGSGLPADGLYPVDGPHNDARTTAISAVLAVAAMAATAWLGVRWRDWCAQAVGQDWIGAALEDVASIGLSVAAARLATTS